MTTLGIRYLTGHSVAGNTAREPEWPPHPGRVFMAFAATYFETRGDEHERAALKWIEEAGAPAVQASDHRPRSFVETYVPANDKLAAGPGLRTRQARSFATTRPDHDCIYLTWKEDVPDHIRAALERLCTKVTRIGHSSSLVQVWLADQEGGTNAEWRPENLSFTTRMRVPEQGIISYLQKEFNQESFERYARLTEALESAKGAEKSRLKKRITEEFPEGRPRTKRPMLTRWQGYAQTSRPQGEDHVRCGPFDRNLIVLAKIEGRTLGLETTLQLTSALRDAAMKAAGERVPEWLSGHQSDGQPSLRPHAAFFPLPFVGAEHADGHVMGLAIAIPSELDVPGKARETALHEVIGPLLFRETGEEKTVCLWRTNVWKWTLEREKREYPPKSLRAKTWTGPSPRWASVTPVVLHHYPKPHRDGDVKRILQEAFESARLPQPVRLRLLPVSLLKGAGYARSVPEFTDGGATLCRYQVHIDVEFQSPVEGPLLVGRGRYRGYGLLRPMEGDLG